MDCQWRRLRAPFIHPVLCKESSSIKTQLFLDTRTNFTLTQTVSLIVV